VDSNGTDGFKSAGIAYLNRYGIIHRDIRQENGLALVVDDEVVKVCDFGLCRQAENTKMFAYKHKRDVRERIGTHHQNLIPAQLIVVVEALEISGASAYWSVRFQGESFSLM